MVKTTESLTEKIVYLKENGLMPKIENETLDIQNMIRSFYYRKNNKDINYWFKLAFECYDVTDDFVREVTRQYKRLKILHIAKDEEFTD